MTAAPALHRRLRFRSSEEGATAVEAALVLSVFIGTVFAVVDFAQAFFIWNTLQLVVGQASRYVIVQNGIPGSICDATCAQTALQTAISSAQVCNTPTAGQYCVNATCNPSSCSSTPSAPTPTMTLSALYGFNFVGLHTSTLTGQITVPIGLPPD